MPVVNEIVAALEGRDSNTPFGQVLEDIKETAAAAQAKKFNTMAVARAGTSTVGQLTGLPSSQINRTLSAINAQNKGEPVTPLSYLTGYHKPKPQ